MNGVIELLGLDKAIAGALGQFGEAGGLAVKIALLAWLAWGVVALTSAILKAVNR